MDLTLDVPAIENNLPTENPTTTTNGLGVPIRMIPAEHSFKNVIEPEKKKLKILHITTTDPAGAAFNLVTAVNQHTQHRARLITTVPNPAFGFQKDIEDMYDRGEEVEALLEQADVYHFHKIQEDHVISYDFQSGHLEFDLEKYAKGKKIVYHIHGHPYEREHVEENAKQYAAKGRIVLASTPDLEEMYRAFYPDVHYFPNCVPINDVRYLPRETDLKMKAADGSEWIIVFQSGTNSILKNMHVIRDVMEKIGPELKAKFLHTTPENIQPQDSVLRHKRISHVVFDHLEGYYGLSSLEGLSMGKPVIAGLNEYSVNAICNFFGITRTDIPWVIPETPTAENVEKCLRMLLESDSLRTSIGHVSRKFMEEVWSDTNIAKRLALLYEAL